ncbi:MAG: hypothetical protein JST54_22465 [Deltaproteobacteria bacterium]|nr:hypothetical protein [Deltaproteobacteria bacterium]
MRCLIIGLPLGDDYEVWFLANCEVVVFRVKTDEVANHSIQSSLELYNDVRDRPWTHDCAGADCAACLFTE